MQCKRNHAENGFLKYVYSVMKFTLFQDLVTQFKLQRKLRGMFHKSYVVGSISRSVSLIDLQSRFKVPVIFIISNVSTFLIWKRLPYTERNIPCQLVSRNLVTSPCTFEMLLHINYVFELCESLNSWKFLTICEYIPTKFTDICLH